MQTAKPARTKPSGPLPGETPRDYIARRLNEYREKQQRNTEKVSQEHLLNIKPTDKGFMFAATAK